MLQERRSPDDIAANKPNALDGGSDDLAGGCKVTGEGRRSLSGPHHVGWFEEQLQPDRSRLAIKRERHLLALEWFQDPKVNRRTAQIIGRVTKVPVVYIDPEIGANSRLDRGFEPLVPRRMQRLLLHLGLEHILVLDLELAVWVTEPVAVGRREFGSVQDIHPQGTHVVDTLGGIQLHLHRNVSGTDRDLAHFAIRRTHRKLRRGVKNALQRSVRITRQLGNRMFFTVISRIILVHQTQRNLGELEFTHESVTNCTQVSFPVFFFVLASDNILSPRLMAFVRILGEV